MHSNLITFFKAGVNGVFGVASTVGGVYVSYLEYIETFFRVSGLILGCLCGFISLGIALKTLGLHLPGYSRLLRYFGHQKNKNKE